MTNFFPLAGHRIQFSPKSCSEENKIKTAFFVFVVVVVVWFGCFFILCRGGSVTHWKEGAGAGWVVVWGTH